MKTRRYLFLLLFVLALPGSAHAAYVNSSDDYGVDGDPSAAVPAGAASGDTVICAVTTDDNTTTFTWPAGFTQLARTANTFDGQAYAVAWKSLTAADTGTYTVDAGGNIYNWVMQCALFSGRADATPTLTDATNNNGNSPPISLSAPSIAASDGDDLMWIGGLDKNGAYDSSFTAPGAFTERQDETAGYSSLSIATEDDVAAGSTGTVTGTAALTGGQAAWYAFLVRIPAPAAPPLNMTLVRPPNNLGLVGYWSFDDATGTTATDFSGNGNIGTLSTDDTIMPQWVNGRLGKALSFDGNEAYVGLANSTTLDPGTGTFTVSAWVKMSSDCGTTKICFIYNDYGTGDTAAINLDLDPAGGSTIEIAYRDNGGHEINASVNGSQALQLTDGRWHLVTGVRDTQTHDILYIDGIGVATGSNASAGTITLSTGPAPRIGDIGDDIDRKMDGSIDDVRIYNRALSANEVASLYSSRVGAASVGSAKTLQQGTTLAQGLVGYWSFDGGDVRWSSPSAGVAYDRSGSNNTGTLTNMNQHTSVDAGVLGQALSFNGSNSYVRVATFASQPASTMTVCAWIKTSYTAGDQVLLEANRNATNIVNEGVFKIVGGKLRFWDYNGAAYGFADAAPDSNTTVTDGNWHHACFVKSGTAGTFYLDGAADGTKTAALDVSYGSADWVIGYDYRGSNLAFNGNMDDARVYNRALSAAEVKQLYQLGQVKIR